MHPRPRPNQSFTAPTRERISFKCRVTFQRSRRAQASPTRAPCGASSQPLCHCTPRELAIAFDCKNKVTPRVLVPDPTVTPRVLVPDPRAHQLPPRCLEASGARSSRARGEAPTPMNATTLSQRPAGLLPQHIRIAFLGRRSFRNRRVHRHVTSALAIYTGNLLWAGSSLLLAAHVRITVHVQSMNLTVELPQQSSSMQSELFGIRRLDRSLRMA